MNKLLIIVNYSVLRKTPNIKATAMLRPLEILYVLDWDLAVFKKNQKNLWFLTQFLFFSVQVQKFSLTK